MRFLCGLTLFTSIAASQTLTTVSITLSPTPFSLGQRTLLIAQVTPPITGTVEFLDGFEVLGTAVVQNTPLANVSVATLWVRFTVPKTYRIRAVHSASGTVASGSSPLLSVSVTGRTTRSFNPQSNPAGEVFVDVNNDGHPDALGTSVRLWTSIGTYGPAIPRPGGTIVTVVDYNNDGKPDILTTEGKIAFGIGDGTFGPEFATTLPTPQPYTLDLNRDGKPDAVGYTADTLKNVFSRNYSLGQGGQQSHLRMLFSKP